jgi:hypothetical protein
MRRAMVAEPFKTKLLWAGLRPACPRDTEVYDSTHVRPHQARILQIPLLPQALPERQVRHIESRPCPVSLPHWSATTGPPVTRPAPPCSERSTTLPRRSADADFTKNVAPAPQARTHELYLDATLLTVRQATHPSRARPGCPAETTSPPSSAGM